MPAQDVGRTRSSSVPHAGVLLHSHDPRSGCPPPPRCRLSNHAGHESAVSHGGFWRSCFDYLGTAAVVAREQSPEQSTSSRRPRVCTDPHPHRRLLGPSAEGPPPRAGEPPTSSGSATTEHTVPRRGVSVQPVGREALLLKGDIVGWRAVFRRCRVVARRCSLAKRDPPQGVCGLSVICMVSGLAYLILGPVGGIARFMPSVGRHSPGIAHLSVGKQQGGDGALAPHQAGRPTPPTPRRSSW